MCTMASGFVFVWDPYECKCICLHLYVFLEPFLWLLFLPLFVLYYSDLFIFVFIISYCYSFFLCFLRRDKKGVDPDRRKRID